MCINCITTYNREEYSSLLTTIGDQVAWYSHPPGYYAAMKNKRKKCLNKTFTRQKQGIKQYFALIPKLLILKR